MKNKENQKTAVTAEKYKEKIVKMVRQVEDVWILEQIHKFVINMTKEGD